MKNYKMTLLFALVASFSGVSAEEEMGNEISMAHREASGECSSSRMEIDYYRHDPNDADYDKYTQGSGGDCCECEDAGAKSCHKGGRKGAAKAAQE
jgi:hypothetical protein